MQLNPDDLRRHYDRLSDEALLEIPREDLVDLARDILDAELGQRGLARGTPAAQAEAPSETAHGEMTGVLEFSEPGETAMARALLESAGIPCQDAKDLRNRGQRIMTQGPYFLAVPQDLLEQAREVLAAEPISDEELAAQAEAAGLPADEEER